MPKYIPPETLIGVKIHRLTCTGFYEENGTEILKLSCECGNSKDLPKKSFTGGQTKSCGCVQKEHIHRYNKSRIGVPTTHGKTNTVEYIAWRNMKARCDDPNHPAYENYGGRCIGYDPRWKTFEGFYEDMGESNGLTLDRIDVNGDYQKENCEWADCVQQSYNRRKSGKNATCKYKGVSFNKAFGKYKAAIRADQKYVHLGYSDDPELLACRYDAALKLVYGDGGATNKSLGLTDKTLQDYNDNDFYKYIDKFLATRIGGNNDY